MSEREADISSHSEMESDGKQNICRNKHQRCKYSNVVKHFQAIITYLICTLHTGGYIDSLVRLCTFLSFFSVFLFFLRSHNYLQECGNTISAFTFQSRACGWIQCFTLIKHPLCSLMSVYMCSPCPPLSSFSALLDWLIHWTHPVPIRPRGFGSDSIWVVCLLTRQLPS